MEAAAVEAAEEEAAEEEEAAGDGPGVDETGAETGAAGASEVTTLPEAGGAAEVALPNEETLVPAGDGREPGALLVLAGTEVVPEADARLPVEGEDDPPERDTLPDEKGEGVEVGAGGVTGVGVELGAGGVTGAGAEGGTCWTEAGPMAIWAERAAGANRPRTRAV